jgi:hypothetical protein
MGDLVDVFPGDLITAQRQNDINDYIHDGTHKINTLAIDIEGTATQIWKDGSGNMSFKDANAGTLTLSEMHCPPKEEQSASTVAEGNYNLTGFGGSKILIKWIKIVTSSTDWDLALYSDDQHSNDEIEIVKGRSGNMNVYVDLPYEDKDATSEVHVNFTDNSGANTYNITVLGYRLR